MRDLISVTWKCSNLENLHIQCRSGKSLSNHSPTGITRGHEGSGPAQCAFAVLMDYLGEEPARALYQQFKFNVILILILPMNEAWILTGCHIEQEIVRIEARSKQP